MNFGQSLQLSYLMRLKMGVIDAGATYWPFCSNQYDSSKPISKHQHFFKI